MVYGGSWRLDRCFVYNRPAAAARGHMPAGGPPPSAAARPTIRPTAYALLGKAGEGLVAGHKYVDVKQRERPLPPSDHLGVLVTFGRG
eukprot:3031291-Prymnesium_polylepis.1